MSDVEQIYALFVEANPVSDPATLPETYEEARPMLRAVPSDMNGTDEDERYVPIPGQVSRRRNRRTALVAAAVAVLVVGVAAMLLRLSADDAAPPATDPTTSITEAFVPVSATAQATTFVDRLDAGDVDGAIGLLADPLASIWFPPLGQVTSTEDVRDYLEFYDAIGTTTKLSECTSEVSGPGTIVTCQANQQSEVLTPLGLEFPVFQMQFQIWNDGIRTIEFGLEGTAGMNAAFNSSRFFEFRNKVLIPRGLIQESLDPIWSKANGELIAELVAEFLANNP
jgi:hypothetical protein